MNKHTNIQTYKHTNIQTYKHTNIQTYKQSYLNSCGAASLLCAAVELGSSNIRLNMDTYCEKDIYQKITNSNINSDPNTWGISKPSDIVRVARLLGLNATVVVYKTWAVAFQRFIFPNEVKILKEMNAYKKIDSSFSLYGPSYGERELKVLISRSARYFGSMHYVMCRPDNSIMDPGLGKNRKDIFDTKYENNMHGAGVSIFLSRGQLGVLPY